MKISENFRLKKEFLKEYYGNDWKNFSKDFFAGFLGATIPYAPLYTLYENIIPKVMGKLPESLEFLHSVLPDMGEENSKLLKLGVLPIVGVGGYVVDKIRLFSRSKFKKKSFWKHDSFFSYVHSSTNVIPYLFAFGFDLKKAVNLTLGSGPISVVIGSLDAYTTDILKNLFGFKPKTKGVSSFEIPDRLPKFMKGVSSKIKYGLAGLLTLGSFATTYGIFEYSNSLSKEFSKEESNEIRIGKLELKTLDELFPEFKSGEIRNYVASSDGVRVDTQKHFFKKK
ncbi:MAG: hypothetical protein NUV46_04185 [Nanoarchaeota archaeon]|nr:hypothetical protein [Nanoarchaeota archaeon]